MNELVTSVDFSKGKTNDVQGLESLRRSDQFKFNGFASLGISTENLKRKVSRVYPHRFGETSLSIRPYQPADLSFV